MSDTLIDNLQIQIKSNSTNAAAEVRSLATALGELKRNGSLATVVKNLNGLSTALKTLTPVASNASKINSIATSLNNLKSVGSFGALINNLNKIPTALKGIASIELGSAESKIKGIANAMSPLANVNAKGFNAAINGLAKIAKITEALNDDVIEAFTDKVKKLSDALEPLSKRLTTVASGLKGFNSKAKTASNGAKEMGDGIDVLSHNFANFTQNLKTVFQAIQNVINKLVEMTDAAIQWDGVAHRFGRGFGAQAQETYEYILKLNEAMGINVQAFMQHSSIYATMLTGFGVAQKDASKMAIGYMELTYDIWAGYNDIYKSFEDAAEAVRSAIAGEVEPIRRAGFTIVEATLEVTAANHGITKSVESMTEAEKSYLRYLTLVDQAMSQSLVGTYASELDTAEGLMRTFSQQLKTLTQAFGSLFLPVLVRVMPYIQAFVNLLTELVRITAGIFGIEIQEVDWGGYNEGSTSLDNVTDSFESATNAAKELKNATLGVDELNVISPDTGAGSSGGSNGGSSGGFGGIYVDSLWDDTIFKNINSQVDDIVASMKNWLKIGDDVDTWAELMDTRLGTILKTVVAIGSAIAAWKITVKIVNLANALSKLEKLSIAKPIKLVFSGIIALAGYTITLLGLKDAIKNGLDGINFVEILAGGLLTTAGAALFGKSLAEWITTAFSSSAVSKAISNAGSNIGVSTAGAVGKAWGLAIAGIITGLPMYFTGLFDACKEGLNWLNGSLVGFGATLTGAGIGGIIGMISGGPIVALWGALIGLFVGLLTDAVISVVQEWDEIIADFKKWGNWFVNFFKSIGNWFTTDFVGFFKNIGNWFATDFVGFFKKVGDWFKNDFVGFFVNAWESITNIDWNQVGYKIGYALGSAVKWVADLFKKIGNWFATDFVNFFKKIGNWFATDFVNFFKSIGNWFATDFVNFFKSVGNWFATDFVNFFKKIGNWFATDFLDFFRAIGDWFATDFLGFFTNIPNWNVWKKEYWAQLGKNILDGIVMGWQNFVQKIKDFCAGFVKGFKDALGIHSPSTVFASIGKDLIAGLLNGITAAWKAVTTFFTGAWNGIKTGAQNAWKGIKNAFSSAGNWFSTSVATPIKNTFNSAWNTLKSGAKSAWSGIKSTFSTVGSFFKNTFTNAWNAVKNVFSSGGKIFNGIKDGIVNAFKTIVNALIKGINAVVRVPFNGLNTILKKLKNIKILGVEPFKWLSTINVPQMPLLANGGIVDYGQMFIARERGPEMVGQFGRKTGVVNNEQIVTGITSGVAQANAEQNALLREQNALLSALLAKNMSVVLDGRELSNSVDNARKSRGASIFGTEVYSY